MTDDELREAISTAREEKPEITGNLENGLPKYWKPYVIPSIKRNPNQDEQLKWIIYYDWYPVDWLSWEYAGRLLEEIIADVFISEVELYFSFNWIIGYRYKSCPREFNGDSLPRAICEAYLEWKTKC